MRCWGLILAGIVLTLGGCSHTKIAIREAKEGGKTTVEIENKLFKTVLVPEIARLPLSYFFKTTGHEEMIHPVSLNTPNEDFVYYGGVIDSIPWVSGQVGDVRLPDKGYLYSSTWTFKTGRNKNSVWFRGQTSFSYHDPVTGKPATLLFSKEMRGYAGSTQLRMDYRIKNIGKTDAKFTFCMHARAGVAKWDKGDYFYAPGTNCFVYYMNNMTELERQGLRPPCWTNWPLKEAMDLQPQEDPRNIHVILPADWSMVGDEKYLENLFFVASKVKCGAKESQMKMGIFMTNAGYVVEPCLTYSISGSPVEWSAPGTTLLLGEGEECTFSIHLVAYQGLSKSQIPQIHAVYPECLFLDKPKKAAVPGGMKLEGRMAFPASGTLAVEAGGGTLRECSVSPGIFDLATLGVFPADKGRTISLRFQTAAGVVRLAIE